MRTVKGYTILLACLLFAGLAFAYLIRQNNRLREDRDTYKNNTYTLIGEVEHYKSKSGRDAVRIGELSLKVSELEKHRSEDARLIKDLRINKRDLESIVKTHQETIYKLKGTARDTIIKIVEKDVEVFKNAKCAKYSDQWIDFYCCIFEDDSFETDIRSRDRITVVETVEYKRFLGFLWKTGKIKKREQSVLNDNPNVEITDAEFITIR